MTNTIKQKTKYSGVEWFGNTTDTFKVIKIKFLGNLIAGGTPKTEKEEYWGGDIPWLPSGVVQNCIVSNNDEGKYITEKGLKESATKEIPENSPLIALTGATCANVALLKFKATANQSVIGLAVNNENDPEFLYYSFLANREQFLIYKTGGAQGGINLDNVKNVYLSIPPLKDQVIISQYLNTKTEQIKKFINDKKKLITFLQEQKKTIIYDAVTKGVEGSIKTKSSGIEWLENIPEDWQVRRLKYVSKVRVSNVDKKSEDEHLVRLCNYVDVYKNDIITNDLGFMEATATKDQIEKFLLKQDDVIITKDSEAPDDIGVPAYIDVSDNKDIVCGYHLAIITPDNSILLGRYLFRLFETKLLRSYFEVNSNGVTRYGLDTYSMLNVSIPLPPINTQKIIIDYLNTEIPKIDQAIHTVQQEIELIEEYKKSLIYQAVTGKIKTLLTNK